METKAVSIKKEFPKISLFIIGLVAIICFLIVFILSQYTLVPISKDTPPMPITQACSQDAVQCPDGSFVGRTGPNCEAVCPIETGSGNNGTGGNTRVCSHIKVRCSDGSYVGQTGPDCKIVCPTNGGSGSGRTSCSNDADCASNETCLDPSPVAQIDSEANKVCWPKGKTTPICLSKGTLIDTPQGNRSVEDLRAGDIVWSQTAQGEKTAVPVQRISHTKAPVNHKVVHLILKDGREVKASPHHPLADGREIGSVTVNDSVNGSIVVSAVQETYQNVYTYDILPQSETGFYWADGILLSSTLK